ncbi:MAG TPA: chorismate mutase [Candidatus Angelobacter sp.]|nr:chorismate mutase [Candidatus Angelobacter sp.]
MRKHENGCAVLQGRRKAIDLLDAELVRLLNERAQIARELASIKKSSGLPVYDARREQEILERISGQNHGPLDSQGLTSIFRCIIRESRKLEASSMRRLNKNLFKQESINGNQYGSKRIRS